MGTVSNKVCNRRQPLTSDNPISECPRFSEDDLYGPGPGLSPGPGLPSGNAPLVDLGPGGHSDTQCRRGVLLWMTSHQAPASRDRRPRSESILGNGLPGPL